MLRPEQLADGPIRVVCNCCDKATKAGINRLENMDGSKFDEKAWLASRNSREPDDGAKEEELQSESGSLSP